MSVISASYNNATADIVYNEGKIPLKEIIATIESHDIQRNNDYQHTDGIRNIRPGSLFSKNHLIVMLQSMGIQNLLVPSQLADTKMG